MMGLFGLKHASKIWAKAITAVQGIPWFKQYCCLCLAKWWMMIVRIGVHEDVNGVDDEVDVDDDDDDDDDDQNDDNSKGLWQWCSLWRIKCMIMMVDGGFDND